jgi:hypothetical protein
MSNKKLFFGKFFYFLELKFISIEINLKEKKSVHNCFAFNAFALFLFDIILNKALNCLIREGTDCLSFS